LVVIPEGNLRLRSIGGSKINMSKTTETYGIPDEENPEWTPETFKRAKRFQELPEDSQRLLRDMKNAEMKPEPQKNNHDLPNPDVVPLCWGGASAPPLATACTRL
jgi:hypothetical protein